MIKGIVIDLLQMSEFDDFELVLTHLETFKTISKQCQNQLVNRLENSKRFDTWKGKGFKKDTAQHIAIFPELSILPDLFYLIQQGHKVDHHMMALVLNLNDEFNFTWLRRKITKLDVKNKWETSQREQLLRDIRMQRLFLIKLILDTYGHNKIAKLNMPDVIDSLSKQYKGPLKDYFSTVSQLRSRVAVNLITLTVTVNRLNFLFYSSNIKKNKS